MQASVLFEHLPAFATATAATILLLDHTILRLRPRDRPLGRPARSCTLLPAAVSAAAFVDWLAAAVLVAAAFPVPVVAVDARVCSHGTLLHNVEPRRPPRHHCYHSRPRQSSRCVHSADTASFCPEGAVSAARPSAGGRPAAAQPRRPARMTLPTVRPRRPQLPAPLPPQVPPLRFLRFGVF